MEGTPDQPDVVDGESTERLNVLLVDDDNAFAHRLGKALEDRGLNVEICTTIENAGSVIRLGHLDILITDLRIGDENGLELVKLCREVSPNIKSLVLTGYGHVSAVVSAVKLGATEFLSKPADADEILEILGLSQPEEQSGGPCLTPAEQVRWEHINRVLAENGYNISMTARLLRLHRRTLQRLLTRGQPR
ncbi:MULTISPECIES: response regulator [unclassified Rhizobium]|uniref:response regulator transcription factor n=1 Tax=unclassified Rhizobium TaxID=2613769 RepID=UPI00160F05DE|nr:MULTISPECIES: response regulator [unclassified Rhizobium]MBB3320300.1 two-component system response regulator RegA [Rhizobium sp. BK181]MBB3545388.1 two-component system response regulator RegA [Rhizobium sp. BK399]MCS3743982.1 two-component system response regulator RegA [Rhizobium sp. BK661]